MAAYGAWYGACTPLISVRSRRNWSPATGLSEGSSLVVPLAMAPADPLNDPLGAHVPDDVRNVLARAHGSALTARARRAKRHTLDRLGRTVGASRPAPRSPATRRREIGHHVKEKGIDAS
jgi:hypothetical protein